MGHCNSISDDNYFNLKKLIILNTKIRVMKNPIVENIKGERMSQKSFATYNPLEY